jgi:hypothetical protein
MLYSLVGNSWPALQLFSSQLPAIFRPRSSSNTSHYRPELGRGERRRGLVAPGPGTAVWLSPMVVLIAVRCDFERNYWLHPHLVQCLLSITVRQQVPKGIEPFVTLIFGKGGAAANAAAEEFLEHKQAEWLGIWDSDATPPVDILQILSDIPDDVSIITPVTFMQLPAEGVLP